MPSAGGEIGRDEPHAATDDVLNAAHTLMAKLALALFDDAGRTGEVLARINRSDRGWADAVRWANRGAQGYLSLWFFCELCSR